MRTQYPTGNLLGTFLTAPVKFHYFFHRETVRGMLSKKRLFFLILLPIDNPIRLSV